MESESKPRLGRTPLRDYVEPALRDLLRTGGPVTVSLIARRVKALQGPALSEAQTLRTLREMVKRGYPVRETRGEHRLPLFEWVREGSEEK